MNYVESQRSILQQNGFLIPKTSGRSMRPLIWGQEHRVVVAPMRDEPSLGDILLFTYNVGGNDINIVHRLVEIRREGGRTLYVTRGDNCFGCEYVTRSEIIGRVAEVHRLSGFRPWHAIPKKKFAVTDTAYLRYIRIWDAIWPLRRVYYLLRGRAGSLSGRLRALFRKR